MSWRFCNFTDNQAPDKSLIYWNIPYDYKKGIEFPTCINCKFEGISKFTSEPFSLEVLKYPYLAHPEEPFEVVIGVRDFFGNVFDGFSNNEIRFSSDADLNARDQVVSPYGINRVQLSLSGALRKRYHIKISLFQAGVHSVFHLMNETEIPIELTDCGLNKRNSGSESSVRCQECGIGEYSLQAPECFDCPG